MAYAVALPVCIAFIVIGGANLSTQMAGRRFGSVAAILLTILGSLILCYGITLTLFRAGWIDQDYMAHGTTSLNFEAWGATSWMHLLLIPWAIFICYTSRKAARENMANLTGRAQS